MARFVLMNKTIPVLAFDYDMNRHEVTRLAPVFDSGSRLWSNAELLDAPIDFEYLAKPFKLRGMRPADQVKLFTGHFDWLDASAFEGYPEHVAELLGSNPNITERRVSTVANQVRKNIETLLIIAR